MNRFRVSDVLIHAVVVLFALFCFLPFLMVVGGSFTGQEEIMKEGFKIIPRQFNLRAYEVLAVQRKVIFTGYFVSILQTSIGTVASLLICSLLAYPLSLKTLRYRRQFSFYVIFTMLFSGGMVPWYIVVVNYLHLKDNLAALIVPGLCNAFNVLLLRNYFESLPAELYESMKIDGAGELTIFMRIVIPLSTPVLATVTLFVALYYWNDWWLGIMLIDKTELQPLQLLLRTIVSNIQFLKSTQEAAAMLGGTNIIPSESIKLATCVVTIGPIVLLYPFVQRYFIKGIMIGALKG